MAYLPPWVPARYVLIYPGRGPELEDKGAEAFLGLLTINDIKLDENLQQKAEKLEDMLGHKELLLFIVSVKSRKTWWFLTFYLYVIFLEGCLEALLEPLLCTGGGRGGLSSFTQCRVKVLIWQ